MTPCARRMRVYAFGTLGVLCAAVCSATVGGSPAPLEIQEIRKRPDVFDRAQGQEIVDGLLAQLGGNPRTVTIRTLLDGWAPGQAVSVDIAGRAVDATFAVTAVSISLRTADYWWAYTVTAVELDVFPGTYLDQWRAMLNGSSSGLGVSVGTSSGVSVVSSTGHVQGYLGGSRYHAVQVPA